jgi:peptidoglycan/xylan/chitin deacetylase (PgdA/CDA1 family)
MNGVLALGYHGVSERWDSPLGVRPHTLRRQIELLLGRGYRAVTVAEAARAAREGVHEPLLVITFDDAVASVYRLAFPILRELGAVATVYAPTLPVLADRSMAWPEVRRHLATAHAAELRPMTFDQLHEVLEAGWEVGSHTRTHPWLPRLGDAALTDELERSRTELQTVLGIACDGLAYPFGAHDDRVVTAAHDAGYTTAVTLPRRLTPWPGPADDPEAYLRLSRIGIYRADDMPRFRLKVTGAVRALRRTPVWDALAHVKR